ncbi:MAG TPA: EAL domain-containing protein [Geminicoccaceae bacterium]|nr:EAL domain-containing protein [Geminicoccaceae bacterium]
MINHEVGQGNAGASSTTTPGLASQGCAPRDRLLLDLMQKQPLLIALNLLLACLLVAALEDVVATPRLLGWLGIMFATQVVRFGVWWHLRLAATTLSPRGIGRRLTWASLLSGIGWGLAGLLLVIPGAPLQMMVTSFFIGGVTASAIMVLPSHPIAYYAFILPALLPYAARLGFAADPTAQMMGLLIFVYLGGISLVGYQVYRSLRQAIDVHVDNARVIAELETRRRALQQAVERSSVELATIMETVPASLWIVHDPEGRRITGSRYAAERLRLERGRNQSLSAAELERPVRYQILRDGVVVPADQLPLQRAGRGETVEGEELRVLFDDGSHYDELVSAVPIRDAAGNVMGAVGAGIDITARRQAEEALRLSEQRFRDFAMSASDWLWETDAEHRFTWFSPNVQDLVGVPPEWHYGKTRREIMAPGVDPELVEAHWQVLEAHAPFRDVEYLRRGPDGDRWLSSSGVPIFDEAGRFQGYRGVGRNINERKLVEAELAHLAHHDSLTTLANRHTLQRQLEHALALASRHQRPGALLLFDLDSFKEVNDVHGHMIGDQLLRMVASRLRPAIRESDTFARFGGDEFAVVAPDVAGEAGAADLAERLVKLMAEPFRVGDGEVQIGASIGVALFPEGSNDPDQLITRADRALYWAKQENRGRVRFYDRNIDAEMQRHRQLKSEMRHALERDELELYYQPQLDLATDRCTGVEALVRWRHPERGLLAAGEFIPIADAGGLSIALDAWVLREACRQARVWRDRGQPLKVAINLSQAQLSQADILATVAATLEATGASANCLELEITERFLMEGFSETTERNLKALAAHEIELALDDFGQGYSSLASLRTLPVGKIKIDRAFIAGIGRIEQDEALVGLIVTLGQRLGKRVLAEGVETERQLEFLRQVGCDEAQGYLIGRPAPAEEIILGRNRSLVAAAGAVAACS